MLIQDVHHFNVFRLFRRRFVIDFASIHCQQFALLTNRQSRRIRLDEHGPHLHIPSLLQLFFRNSFSTFNWPICAYNSWVSTDSCSAGAAFSKAAAIFSSNSAFHLEIITGFTSNFLASSASVCWFFTASRATLALKVGENLRRVCFCILR